MSKVSMLALVGADRNIGPKDGLPVFANREDQREFLNWVSLLTDGQIMVIGSHTLKIMRHLGIEPVTDYHTTAVWSRKAAKTPEDFIAKLKSLSRQHIYICGGATTFRLFAPLCDNFYIRRAELRNSPDYRLDPIFPGWQNSVQGVSDEPRRLLN